MSNSSTDDRLVRATPLPCQCLRETATLRRREGQCASILAYRSVLEQYALS